MYAIDLCASRGLLRHVLVARRLDACCINWSLAKKELGPLLLYRSLGARLRLEPRWDLDTAANARRDADLCARRTC